MVQPRARQEETFDDHDTLVSELRDLVRRYRDPQSDPVIRQLMILAAPELLADRLSNALLAAVGEHLAVEAGIRVPQWVTEAERGALETPTVFRGLSSCFRHVTPIAFLKRNVHLA